MNKFVLKDPDPKDVIVLFYEKMLLCQLPQKSLLLTACLNEGEDDFGVRRIWGRK